MFAAFAHWCSHFVARSTSSISETIGGPRAVTPPVKLRRSLPVSVIGQRSAGAESVARRRHRARARSGRARRRVRSVRRGPASRGRRIRRVGQPCGAGAGKGESGRAACATSARSVPRSRTCVHRRGRDPWTRKGAQAPAPKRHLASDRNPSTGVEPPRARHRAPSDVQPPATCVDAQHARSSAPDRSRRCQPLRSRHA